MGGYGSGGARPGSGSKPNPGLAALGPSRGRQKAASDATAAVDLPEVVDPPADLPPAARTVWESLAPHATAARTLAPSTALMFARLCRHVVLEQALADSPEAGGPDHRGVVQRVDAELLKFCLSPIGKALATVAPAVQPANPLDKFLRRVR